MYLHSAYHWTKFNTFGFMCCCLSLYVCVCVRVYVECSVSVYVCVHVLLQCV